MRASRFANFSVIRRKNSSTEYDAVQPLSIVVFFCRLPSAKGCLRPFTCPRPATPGPFISETGIDEVKWIRQRKHSRGGKIPAQECLRVRLIWQSWQCEIFGNCSEYKVLITSETASERLSGACSPRSGQQLAAAAFVCGDAEEWWGMAAVQRRSPGSHDICKKGFSGEID